MIGKLFDLVQPVRDVDDRYLFLTQLPDELEQPVDIGLLKRLGRLVEKKNLGLCGNGARDLNDMLLCERQVADPRAQ